MAQAQTNSVGSSAASAGMKSRAIGAVKWTVLSEVASKLFPPLVTVILAKLLTPEDYGIVGVAMTALSLLNVIWEAGMGRALVQTERDINKAANSVFWSNFCIGICVYALLFVCAPWLGKLYHEERTVPVLRFMGITVLLGCLTTVHLALFQRELKFKPIFWSKFVSSIIPGLVSIPLAARGAAHWALVAGSLAGGLSSVLIVWKLSSWRPRAGIDWTETAALWKFGIWTLGEAVLAWFYAWGDSALLGAFLSVKELGVYRTGTSIALMVFSTILNPIVPLVYSTLCRLQNDRAGLIAHLTKSIKLVSGVALPAGLGLYLISGNLAWVLFGSKWAGLGQVIGIFGLIQGYTWFISGVTYDGYKAIGRPDVFPKFMFAALIYYVPGYVLSVSKGLDVFTWSRAGLAVVSLPVHLYLMRRILGLELSFIWKLTWPQWAATAVMGLIVLGIQQVLPAGQRGFLGLTYVIAAVFAGASAYILATWWLDRPFFNQFTGLVKRAINRKQHIPNGQTA